VDQQDTANGKRDCVMHGVGYLVLPWLGRGKRCRCSDGAIRSGGNPSLSTLSGLDVSALRYRVVDSWHDAMTDRRVIAIHLIDYYCRVCVLRVVGDKPHAAPPSVGAEVLGGWGSGSNT
jgi:hypothetical protein